MPHLLMSLFLFLFFAPLSFAKNLSEMTFLTECFCSDVYESNGGNINKGCKNFPEWKKIQFFLYQDYDSGDWFYYPLSWPKLVGKPARNLVKPVMKWQADKKIFFGYSPVSGTKNNFAYAYNWGVSIRPDFNLPEDKNSFSLHKMVLRLAEDEYFIDIKFRCNVKMTG